MKKDKENILWFKDLVIEDVPLVEPENIPLKVKNQKSSAKNPYDESPSK